MQSHTKDTNSSTGIPPVTNAQNNSTNPEQTSYATSTPQPSQETILAAMMTQNLETMVKLKDDILRIEKEQDKSRNFYTSVTTLSNVAKIAIVLLMILPIIQITACTIVVYCLGIMEELPPLLVKVLSGISIASIIEVVLIVWQYVSLRGKITLLETKVDTLSDKVNN